MLTVARTEIKLNFFDLWHQLTRSKLTVGLTEIARKMQLKQVL